MDLRRLLETWGFLLIGILGVLYTNAALTENVLYPVLFTVLAASGFAALLDYSRLSGGLFAVAGALALLQSFALALAGGSLLLTAELAVLGLLGVGGGLRRVNDEDESTDSTDGDDTD